jgi:hypothetical protein
MLKMHRCAIGAVNFAQEYSTDTPAASTLANIPENAQLRFTHMRRGYRDGAMYGTASVTSSECTVPYTSRDSRYPFVWVLLPAAQEQQLVLGIRCSTSPAALISELRG